jgi:hypothetical protein
MYIHFLYCLNNYWILHFKSYQLFLAGFERNYHCQQFSIPPWCQDSTQWGSNILQYQVSNMQGRCVAGLSIKVLKHLWKCSWWLCSNMYDLSSLLTYVNSFHQFGRHMRIDLAVVTINSYKSNGFQSKFLNCLARPHPSLDQAAPYFSPTFHA